MTFKSIYIYYCSLLRCRHFLFWLVNSTTGSVSFITKINFTLSEVNCLLDINQTLAGVAVGSSVDR